MTTSEVRELVANLHKEMDQCDEGFGTHCDTVDVALAYYAHYCCEYNMKVASWTHDFLR